MEPFQYREDCPCEACKHVRENDKWASYRPIKPVPTPSNGARRSP